MAPFDLLKFINNRRLGAGTADRIARSKKLDAFSNASRRSRSIASSA
jgi:hypothetical protein